MDRHRVARLSIFALLLTLAGGTWLSTDRAWNGGDGDWDDPDNWNPAGIPGTAATDIARIDGGAVTLGTAYTIATLDVGGGSLDASSDLTVSGTTEITGATVTGTSDLITDALVLDGGVITEMADDCCNIVASGSLELRGPGANTVGRTLVNQGSGSWLGGDLDLTGGTLRNEAGATLTVDTGVDVDVTGGVVENAGSWILQGFPPDHGIVVVTDFLNTGSVDLQSGVLEVEDCCTFTQDAAAGTTIAAGATLRFAGGSHDLGGSVSGDGSVEVSEGAVTVPGGSSFAPARTSVYSGTLTLEAGGSPGLPRVEVAGGTFVTQGDLSVDEGRLTAGIAKVDDCCEIVSTGVLELSGPDPKGIEGTVVNQGAGTWIGGDLDLAAGRLVNDAGGTFAVEVATDVEVTGGVIENAGEWIHRVSDCCEMTGDFDLTNTGTARIESGTLRLGLTCVNPGNPEEDCWNFTQSGEDAHTEVSDGATLAAEVRLSGGVLGGSGTVEGIVTNGFPPSSGFSPDATAWVKPGFPPSSGLRPRTSGVLTVDGEYVQTGDGVLEIGISGGSVAEGFPPGHGLLAVSGAATLGGALEIVPDPDSPPRAGQQFEVMTWASRSGQFADVQGTDVGPDLRLDVGYEADGLVLSVVATSGPAMAAAVGGSGPGSQTTASPGDTEVPVLHAALAAPGGGDHALLQGVTLQASGSGDDAAHIAAVTVHHDADGDGQVGSDDEALATGGYAADDGQLALSFDAPLRIESGDAADLLVSYDLAGSLARTPVAPTIGPVSNLPPGLGGLTWLVLLGLAVALATGAGRPRRHAYAALLVAMALIGVSCGSGDTVGPGGDDGERTVTFGVQLVSVDVQGETSGQAGSVDGLPLQGTTLSVTR